MGEEKMNKIESKFKELTDANQRLQEWIEKRDEELMATIRKMDTEKSGSGGLSVERAPDGSVTYKMGALALRAKTS